MNILQDVPWSFLAFEVIIWGALSLIPFLVYILKDSQKIGAIFFGICWICIAWASFIEPNLLVTRRFEISSENLPNMKIAVVADFHLRPWKEESWVQKVVDQLQQEEFDFVVIPGDFLSGSAKKYADFFRPLKQIQKPVYFVLGNHDYKLNRKWRREGAELLRNKLRQFELLELKNSADFLEKQKTWLIGVEDNYFGFDDLELAQKDVPKNSPKILLAHSPDIVDKFQEDESLDLIISGHTHCGQVRLPFLGALPYTIPTMNGKALEKHWYPDEKIFITCGVGESGPRARFLNPPEIVILEVN